MAGELEGRVQTHYAPANLVQTLERALVAAGQDATALTPEDLAPVDQFHSRGRAATLELAALAALTVETRVLDLGGGLGGAARLLAQRWGCRVTVLELVPAYCQAALWLNQRTGLADRIDVREGSALAPPFDDGSFDLVWTQHAQMNIADRATLYRQVHRLLRPAGRFVMHEILAGPVTPPHFPVPWARDPSTSFLLGVEQTRTQLSVAGLTPVAWQDVSTPSLASFRERAAARSGTPPALGLHLLLGPDAPVMFANQVRNLEERRTEIVMAALQRPQAP